MSQIKHFYADRRICIAFWRNVVIVDISGEMDVPRMTTVGNAYETLLGRHPEGIAAVILLRPGTPVASHEARAEVARFSREIGSSLLRISMVIEDRGVLAQMLRVVVRGISMVVRQTRIQMVDDVAGAIEATLPVISSSSDLEFSRRELGQAIAKVRFSFHPSMRAS